MRRSGGLEAGRLSPPQMVKFEGREQVAVFFKGSYAELLKAVPGVLTNPQSTFHPHFAVYCSPSAEDPEVAETLELLVQHQVVSFPRSASFEKKEGSEGVPSGRPETDKGCCVSLLTVDSRDAERLLRPRREEGRRPPT